MKRILLVLVALAAMAPLPSRAAKPQPVPCVMVPMANKGCLSKAAFNGTIAYAIQGAVEFQVTHAGVTTRSCYFGSGGGAGPRVQKGDGIYMLRRTPTTTLAAWVVPLKLKPGAGTGKPFSC